MSEQLQLMLQDKVSYVDRFSKEHARLVDIIQRLKAGVVGGHPTPAPQFPNSPRKDTRSPRRDPHSQHSPRTPRKASTSPRRYDDSRGRPPLLNKRSSGRKGEK